MNHTFLQKRYREDDIIVETGMIQVKELVVIAADPPSVIERVGNKRRTVDSTQLKKTLNVQASTQMPNQHLQLSKQATVPLTPNLKFSDPLQQQRLCEDKFTLKRSNSQNEFDVPLNILNEPTIEFGLNAIHHFPASTLLMHDEIIGHDISPHLEKSYSVPAFVPQPPNFGAGQLNSFMKCNYRNSFDFLELESQHLLEMTGDNFNTMVNIQNQNVFGYPSTLLNLAPPAVLPVH
jgi:hypothetical protein